MTRKLRSIVPEKKRPAERTEARRSKAPNQKDQVPTRPAKAQRSQRESADRLRVRRTRPTPRRKPPKRKVSAWPLWILLLVLLAPTLFTLWHQRGQISSMQARVDDLSSQKGRLEQDVRSLREELSEVNTDAFIEKYAREKLGMIKSNELVVELDEPVEGSDEEAPDTETERAPEEASGGGL